MWEFLLSANFPAYKSLGTNLMQLFVCVLGGIFCLTPLIGLPDAHLSDFRFKDAVSSTRNRDSGVAAIALVVPIVVQIATETITSYIRGDSNTARIKLLVGRELLNKKERFVLACGLLTIPLTAFLPPETPNLINIYICLRMCRFIYVVGAVMISLCRYNRIYWTVLKTYLSLACMIGSSILTSYSQNYFPVLGGVNGPTTTLALLLSLLAYIIQMYCCISWLCSVIPILYRRLSAVSAGCDDETACNESIPSDRPLVLPVVYVSSANAFATIWSITNRVFPERTSFVGDTLFYYHLFLTLYLVFLMYLSERMMKYEIIKGLYALVESKRVYVRYISHELRTPLNAAFLGLKLVCDDLESSTARKDCEYFETLLDVKSACSIAVEILNDLLSFDKMESGILELHKQDVNVAPLIIDSVNMFASQAKEADVRISIIPADLGSITSASRRDMGISLSKPLTCTSNSVLLGDSVFIDRFKMDQVLRNLLSNALKFTPRGGFVTVCASFIPDTDDDLTTKVKDNKSMSLPSEWLHRALRREPRIHLVTENNQKSSTTDLEYGINNTVNDSNRYLDLVPNPTTHKHSRKKLLDADSSNNMFENSNSNNSNNKNNKNNISNNNNSNNNNNNKNNNNNNISHISNNNAIKRSNDSTATTRESSGLNTLGIDDDYITGKLKIVVKDSGVGISPANIQRLFKEVIQFNPEILQAGGGSGLGLHITSNIVQMHGGTITATSEGSGKGSTFTVEIYMQRKRNCKNDEPFVTAIRPLMVGPSISSSPITVPQGSSSLSLCCESRDGSGAKPIDLSQVIECLNAVTSDDPRSLYRHQDFLDPRTPPMLESYTFNKYTNSNGGDHNSYDVLVVDDSSLNRKLLCKLFRTAGYACEEADDGLRAIEKVKTRMARGDGQNKFYDAILMDFVMPNMDGPTATQAIRALNYPGIIFGVTGNALETDVTHFLTSGVDSVLPKPFDFSLFKQLMKERIENPV